MGKRSRNKIKDTVIMLVGIGVIVAIFVAVFMFAPNNPFEESQFINDVGDAHR